MEKVARIMFALIRFEICKTELSDEVKASINEEVFASLYKLSKKHDLAHLVGDALDKNGFLTENTVERERFLQERNMAIYRYEQMRYEYERICETLEKAEIPFLPLKGAVLRDYYPEAWMRTSCDIDILVKKDDLKQSVYALVTQLRYKQKGIGDHDIDLFAESGVHLELHYSLIEADEKSKAVLSKIWDNVDKVGNYQYKMQEDIFYFYHIAHMANHFKIGGCGVRSFLDVWILHQNISYDEKRAEGFLNEGGLLAFAKAVEQTSNVWFGVEEKTKQINEIENYVLYAGMYGDTKNRVAVEQIKKGGKHKYFWSRIFLPYKDLKYQFKILQKHKWLTPFCQVARWIKLVFSGKTRTAMRELNYNASLTLEEKKRIESLLQNLEL